MNLLFIANFRQKFSGETGPKIYLSLDPDPELDLDLVKILQVRHTA
jgi:hypothetical protein